MQILPATQITNLFLGTSFVLTFLLPFLVLAPTRPRNRVRLCVLIALWSYFSFFAVFYLHQKGVLP